MSTVYQNTSAGVDLTTADWEFPDIFRKSIVEEVMTLDWSRYPDNHHNMCRDIIAEKFALRRNDVLLCNGCSEALQLLFISRKIYGNEIYIPKKSYFAYYNLAESFRLNAIYYDISDTENVISDESSRAPILICLPNNPTGEIINVEAITHLIKATERTIFIDLTYAYFWNQFDESMIRKLTCAGAVLFVSFSKAFALAGIRLGLVISADNTVADFNKSRFRFPMDFFQMVTCKKLFEKRWYDYAMNQISLNRKERGRLASLLKRKYGCNIYPLNCNFVSFDNNIPDTSGQHISNDTLYKLPCKIFRDGLVRLTVSRNIDYSKI